MSTLIDMQQFRDNVRPVDPEHQGRLSLAIMLLERDVPIEEIDDLPAFALQIGRMRDALEMLLSDIALVQRLRGTSQWDIRKMMQMTCPLMAALYRAEAISGNRIQADQSAIANLASVHDLLVEAIEEKMDGAFDNPVYPVMGAQPASKSKRWRKQRYGVEERE